MYCLKQGTISQRSIKLENEALAKIEFGEKQASITETCKSNLKHESIS